MRKQPSGAYSTQKVVCVFSAFPRPVPVPRRSGIRAGRSPRRGERFFASSRARVLLMWVFTVSSERPSWRAATVVDSPSARSWRISRWRLVIEPRLPLGGTSPSMKLSCGDRGDDRLAQLLGPGGAGDVGGRAGAERGAGEVALGPIAVGDDAEHRRGPAHFADRLGAADRGALAVAAPGHVEDRDVEVTDVAHEVDGLPRGRSPPAPRNPRPALHGPPTGPADGRPRQDIVGVRSGLLPITRLLEGTRVEGFARHEVDPNQGRRVR